MTMKTSNYFNKVFSASMKIYFIVSLDHSLDYFYQMLLSYVQSLSVFLPEFICLWQVSETQGEVGEEGEGEGSSTDCFTYVICFIWTCFYSIFFSWCRYFIYKMLDVLSTGLPVSVALGMLPWQTMLPADINACCWCLWLLTFKFDCRS